MSLVRGEPTSAEIRPPAASGLGRTVLLLWLVALVVGAALRLPFLLDETPHFDEWHPLLAAKRQGLERLATTFGIADRSIPVALYLDLLSRADALTDFWMRAPFALVGMGSLVLLPWALWRRRDEGAAIWRPVLALLLAISPLLVYYSRTIRPYGLTTLLAIVAVSALDRARGAPRPRRALAVFVLAAAPVAWLLPVHFPFCAAAAAFACLPVGARRSEASVRPFLVAAVSLACLALLPLVPALSHDYAALDRKAGGAAWQAAAALRVPAMLSGTGSIGLGLLWTLAAMLFGARALWRGDGARSALIAGSAGQFAALAVLRPQGIDDAIILARYLLPLAPVGWVLLFDGARALGGDRVSRRRPGVVALLGVVAAAALYATGPLRGWLGPGPDNFAAMRLHERIAAGEGSLLARRLPPAAYSRIAGGPPGDEGVLEVPYTGYVAEPYTFYQRVHRRPVFLAFTAGFCSRRGTIELPPYGDRGFRLRRILALADLESLRGANVRWVVFHADSGERVGGEVRTNDFYDFRRCVDAFRDLTGIDPVEDGRAALFDLSEPPRSRPQGVSAPGDGRSGP